MRKLLKQYEKVNGLQRLLTNINNRGGNFVLLTTIPRTSPLATLVGSYGVIHSRSLRSYDPCFARFYIYFMYLMPPKITRSRPFVTSVLMSKKILMRGLLYLLSLCLKKIFCLPPTPSACSHSPYIFHAENTWGEKVTVRPHVV